MRKTISAIVALSLVTMAPFAAQAAASKQDPPTPSHKPSGQNSEQQQAVDNVPEPQTPPSKAGKATGDVP